VHESYLSPQREHWIETDRARKTETHLPEANYESGLQACCRSIEIKCTKQQSFQAAAAGSLSFYDC